LAVVEPARDRELLLDPAAADVLLEHPLPETPRALIGVLLRVDELRGDLRRRGCPAEPDARAEGLRRRPRLRDDVRPLAPEARECVVEVRELAIGDVLDDQEAVLPGERDQRLAPLV